MRKVSRQEKRRLEREHKKSLIHNSKNKKGFVGFLSDEDRCSHCAHSKNCKIPIFGGLGHDNIIGYFTCGFKKTG